MIPQGLVFVVVGMGSFVLPLCLLAHRLPRRRAFVGRCLAALAVALVAFGVSLSTSNVLQTNGTQHEVVFFALWIPLSTLLVKFCWNCPWRVALFCATAGYVMQNLGATFSGMLGELPTPPGNVDPFVWTLLSVVVGSVLACLLCYRLFVRNATVMNANMGNGLQALLLVLAVVLVNVGQDAVISQLDGREVSNVELTVLRLSHAVTCLLTLFLEFELLVNRRLIQDVSVARRAMQERSRQYELSRESVDSINARMHDIRHALARTLTDDATSGTLTRETLASALRQVKVYDAQVHTGNLALDTALTQKSLVCRQNGITLSCVADGTCLDSLVPEDVYVLFSSMLGLAMDEELRITDEGKRTIALLVRGLGAMASIHLEYHAADSASREPVELDEVVSRYDGILTSGTQDDARFVNLLLPLS